MDIELEKNINAAVEYLKEISNDKLDFRLMDPIAKMMLVSLLHESQKIKDYVDGIEERIIERFCEDFIPRREIEAMPALSVIEVKFKPKKDSETTIIGNNASFVYKIGDSKNQINYIPIFNTLCIPYQNLYILNPQKLCVGDKVYDIIMDKPNCIWIGINTKVEIDSLKGLSLIIEGTNGILPEHIFVGSEDYELEYSDMTKMENIEMVEPFDSQQSSGQFFSIIENWKDTLTNMVNQSLIFITDETKDRDVFKQRAYPKIFEKWVEEDGLNSFDESTIWLKLEFQNDYIIPENISIKINVMPITNIDITMLR